MQWFFGLFAIVFLLVLGLAFTSSVRATMLVFIPFIALGAWVLYSHFKRGNTAKQHSDPVFTDDHRKDRAA
jgi:hypothetical protein